MLQGNDNYTGTAARDTASALEVMMEAARGVAATTGDRDLQVGQLLWMTLGCYGFHWVTMVSTGLLWMQMGGYGLHWVAMISAVIYQSFYFYSNFACKCLALPKL